MRRSFFALAVILLVAGCSSSSFVGRRLDNFTARYNAFYNAERAFRSGVKAVEKPDERIDRTVYLSIFPEAQGGSIPDFGNAVKKSADVLRKHPSSKWVDDALLLIGKSYFYQQNYVGAEQKFREVMTLQSKLDDEARFWLARTLISSGSYDAAAEHLNVSLAREGLSPRWQSLMRLTLGELHVKRGQWEDAVEALTEGLANVRGNDVRARTQFLLGQVYETLGQYDAAVAAFQDVEHYKPIYELSYAAQLSAARVLGLHGDGDAALQMLRRMERDDKHYNNLAEVAFVRGRVLQTAGYTGDALATYDQILYDVEYNSQAIRGRIHYAMAELYRDAYEDFITAAAHFDTASTAIGQSAAAQRLLGGGTSGEFIYTREAITDSEQQAEVFKSFASVMGDVQRMDSLLWLGSLDDASFQEVVLDLRKRRAEELAEQQRDLERRQVEQGFRNAAVGDVSRSRDTETLATSAGGSSFLFHQEPARVQEGKLLFIDRWGDRPLVPNWRRIEAITALAEAPRRNGGEARQKGAAVDSVSVGNPLEASLPPVDISAVPRDPASRQVMLEDRASSRYELATVLFLSMNRPDSAAAWYRMVIEENPDQEVARRAYYALAEIQRALGDTLAANRLYRDILQRYPDSDFANLVRERLGMNRVNRAGSDSLALADAAYSRAYASWKAGRYREGFQEMLEVAAQFSTTEVAPRALFAAASLYAEWAQRGGADLLGSIPVSLPDSVLREIGVIQQIPAEANALPAPDSLIASAEVREALADSIAVVRQDSMAAASSGGVVPVSGTVNSVGQESPPPLRLDAIYAAIATQYPNSPYADPSRRRLTALEEERKELMAADSASVALQPGQEAAPLSDSPEAVAADSTGVATTEAAGVAKPAEPDTTRQSSEAGQESTEAGASGQLAPPLEQGPATDTTRATITLPPPDNGAATEDSLRARVKRRGSHKLDI